ncbi:unnamed protein product [Merluccius merluccius]
MEKLQVIIDSIQVQLLFSKMIDMREIVKETREGDCEGDEEIVKEMMEIVKEIVKELREIIEVGRRGPEQYNITFQNIPLPPRAQHWKHGHSDLSF